MRGGKLPILIGGGGEKVTLRLVAQYADIWNGFGDPEAAGRKSRILDDWCQRVGRNPAEIERSVSIRTFDPDVAERYIQHGITHLIFGSGGPQYDLGALEAAVRWRDQRQE